MRLRFGGAGRPQEPAAAGMVAVLYCANTRAQRRWAPGGHTTTAHHLRLRVSRFGAWDGAKTQRTRASNAGHCLAHVD